MTDNPQPSQLLHFPVTTQIPVQWGDQDLFGHVNNVVYFRWLEAARMAYLEKAGLAQSMLQSGLGAILASVKCDYRFQVKFPDTVQIGARIDRIGRSSVQIIHAVYSFSQQRIVAEGESIVVAFNYRTQSSTPVSDPLRELVEKFEGKVLPKPAS